MGFTNHATFLSARNSFVLVSQVSNLVSFYSLVLHTFNLMFNQIKLDDTAVSPG